MAIVSIQQTSALSKTLQAGGLSASKASLVESEIAASGKTSITASTKTPDIASVRSAVNQRITQDVVAGKLTAEDAAKINKTLDEMQAAQSGATTDAATTDASSAQAAGGGGSKPAGGGGGGGGGGSSAKVELSRVVTVTGALKTTVITYTDNSTATKTTVDTDPAPKKADAGDGAADLPPGSLVDALA